MSRFDLLKFGLDFFYPRSRYEYDGVRYKSVNEAYKGLVNDVYTNGALYIGEDDEDIVIQTRGRSVPLDYGYLVSKGGRLFFSTKVLGFGKLQTVPILVEYIVDGESLFFETEDVVYFNDFLKIPLDDGVSFDNVVSVTVKSIPSVVYNYVRYGGVESKVFGKGDLSLISDVEFDSIVGV